MYIVNISIIYKQYISIYNMHLIIFLFNLFLFGYNFLFLYYQKYTFVHKLIYINF